MIAILPASVELYLKEAGFTATEILVIRKLLQEEALTLRELSLKTGKSTGVLDMATKKLISKHIMQRTTVNDHNRYQLISLQALVKWVEKDMKKRQEMQQKRHQDFESFIASVSVDKSRPDMQHYEGDAGLQQAYMKLLSSGKEIVGYFPVMYKEEEDPLKDFRVQFFRERRRNKVFLRLIAHDTTLGARFQSRDAFEYRKTLLVDPTKLAIDFEKLIVGDSILCINHATKSASHIQYKDIAATEKSQFEALWSAQVEEETRKGASVDSIQEKQETVSVRTRTISGLREFFLSRKSIATMAVFAVVAGMITFGLYQYTTHLNLQRIREKVISVAATGAIQFQAADIEQIHTREDIKKPEYSKIIQTMNQIRSQNEDVKYMYILRETEDKNMFRFVADADSIDPDIRVDYNDDGVLNEADENVPPGREYDVSEFPILRDRAYRKPIADEKPYTDQWGTFITGYAPIYDENNKLVGVFCVDVFADLVYDLTKTVFIPVHSFLALFLIFIIIRLAAFNKSLFREIINTFKSRKFFMIFVSALCIAIIATVALYFYTNYLTKQRLREKAISIAATGALSISADDVNSLRSIKDVQTDQYIKVVRILQSIRRHNKKIRFVYIYRPVDVKNYMFEFVADADSMDPSAKIDLNGDGIIDQADSLNFPGEPYDASSIDIIRQGRFQEPNASHEAYTDKWGTFITAFAPIKDERGSMIALLGIDIDASQIKTQTLESFNLVNIFSIFITLVSVISLYRFYFFARI